MRGPAYSVTGIDVSPDGRTVYAAGAGRHIGAIAIFAHRSDGHLVQRRGEAGCVSSRPTAGCRHARIPRDPFAARVAPDGRNVYVDGLSKVAIFTVRH
jgi:DNA-binding beta-propeller fold protein YncE